MIGASDTDRSTWRSAGKVAFRVALVIVALAISAGVLNAAFDLDLAAIGHALGSLDDSEILALSVVWIVWLGAQGLQTSSLIRGLPVRQGVIAFLGPAAIAAVIAGPSDLPLRQKMLTSWGSSNADANVAVAASGLFSIGIKIVLPLIAAVGLIVADAPIDGAMRTVVVVILVVALALVAVGCVLGSERRTERLGRLLNRPWRASLRLLRRPIRDNLAPLLIDARAVALDTLRERWLIAAWGTVLAASAKYALLLMSLRFTGVSEQDVGWAGIFVVYALVQGLTVIPITAGDAGTSEVAFIGLIGAAVGGGLVNEVTAAVIVFRVLTWLILIPAGLVAIGIWRLALRRSTRAE